MSRSKSSFFEIRESRGNGKFYRRFEICKGENSGDGAMCPSHLIGKFFFIKFLQPGKFLFQVFGKDYIINLCSRELTVDVARELFKNWLNQNDILMYPSFYTEFYELKGYCFKLDGEFYMINEDWIGVQYTAPSEIDYPEENPLPIFSGDLGSETEFPNLVAV